MDGQRSEISDDQGRQLCFFHCLTLEWSWKFFFFTLFQLVHPFPISLCGPVLCQLGTSYSYQRGGSLNSEKCLHKTELKEAGRGFSPLVIDREEHQPIMDGTTTGMVVTDSIRKQAGQARKNKPISSTPTWLMYQLLLLYSCPVRGLILASCNDGLQCGTLRQMNPFLSNFLLVIGFYHSNNKPKILIIYLSMTFMTKNHNFSYFKILSRNL